MAEERLTKSLHSSKFAWQVGSENTCTLNCLDKVDSYRRASTDPGIHLAELHSPRPERAVSTPQNLGSTRTNEISDSMPLPASFKGVPVFADAEALKDQIPDNLANTYDEEKMFYSKDGYFQQLANSNGFVNMSLLMVLFSSAWIGVEVDNDESEAIFQFVAHFFCMFFSGELLIRFMALESKAVVFSNAFLRLSFGFDFALVLLMIIDTWIVPVWAFATGHRTHTNTRHLLVFRFLRMLRVLRMVRVVRDVPELLLIIKGVIMAVRPIAVVMTLIGLIIYGFAIVIKVALQGTDVGEHRFNSVPATMATLLIDVTLSGTRGGPIMRETWIESPLATILLFVFVVVANITMMGVLGGLLVHTVRTVAEVEKEEHTVKEALYRFDSLWRRFLKEHDGDHDGCISARELRELFQDRQATRILEQIHVDFNDMEDVSEFVFQESGGKLTRSQLQKMILDLRSKNIAKVKDHVVTRKFFQSELQKFGNQLGMCTQLSSLSQ